MAVGTMITIRNHCYRCHYFNPNFAFIVFYVPFLKCFIFFLFTGVVFCQRAGFYGSAAPVLCLALRGDGQGHPR